MRIKFKDILNPMSEKDNLDKRLTVLLIINRCPEYTFRWMSYNNLIDFPFKIVIADGGQEEIVSDVLLNHANFPNLDYTYLHYKESGTPSELLFRIDHAFKDISTPYVLKAANDDFFMVEGIQKALSFLDTHPDYVSSRGEIYDFCVTGASEPRHNSVYGYVTYFRQFSLSESSISEDTAIERVRHQCANICMAWYDIYRTDQLKKYHQILHKLNPTDSRFSDRITDFLPVAEGKLHRGKGLFMLHQANPIQGEGAALLRQFPTYKAWMQTAAWQREYDTFIQTIAESISIQDQIPIDEPKRQFSQMFHDLYLAPRLVQDEQMGQDGSKPEGFLKKALKDMVQKLNNDSLMRKAFTAAVRFKHKQISNSVVKNSKYYKELKPIIEFLSHLSKSSDGTRH